MLNRLCPQTAAFLFLAHLPAIVGRPRSAAPTVAPLIPLWGKALRIYREIASGVTPIYRLTGLTIWSILRMLQRSEKM
jgi:hypothetical protein